MRQCNTVDEVGGEVALWNFIRWVFGTNGGVNRGHVLEIGVLTGRHC